MALLTLAAECPQERPVSFPESFEDSELTPSARGAVGYPSGKTSASAW